MCVIPESIQQLNGLNNRSIYIGYYMHCECGGRGIKFRLFNYRIGDDGRYLDIEELDYCYYKVD